MTCPLCRPSDEQLIWQDMHCRIILVAEPDYPGYCRIIWNKHIKEMTDLSHAERIHLFNILMATELSVRTVMKPDKINLASLGNQVPHLHWHVIPRFINDAHYPDSIWSATQRAGIPRPQPSLLQLKKAIETSI